MKKQTKVSTFINNDKKVKKSLHKNEVQAYLIYTNNKNNLSPLELLKVNGGKYLNVDIAAIK